jgi:hypothetical protein
MLPAPSLPQPFKLLKNLESIALAYGHAYPDLTWFETF